MAEHFSSVRGARPLRQAGNYPTFRRGCGWRHRVLCSTLGPADRGSGGWSSGWPRPARADGVQVAYATAGHGPPLLFVGGWLSHLELSWALPAERRLLESLAQGRTLLRYDRPGCGLSDRPLTSDPSVDGELEVVAAVLAAAGVERTDIVASSLGVPLMIEWAARHPETVDRLVLYGGWARGADIGTTGGPGTRRRVWWPDTGAWGPTC